MFKRSRLSVLVVFLVAFSLGYLAYYYIDKNSIRKLDIQQAIGDLPVEVGEDSNKFVTYVDYDGEKFSENSINMKKGDYLAITNLSSNTQMWLTSTVSALTTKRGYAEGERLQVILYEPGLFKVGEKVSGSVLEVEVQ